MKLISLIPPLLVLSTAVFARNDDLVADLTSAGYAPDIGREFVAQANPASLPLTRGHVSFTTIQQITADLVSAGYGPAGVTSATPVEHAAQTGLPHARANYRTADAIRADLISAGYAPSSDGRKAIAFGAKG
jgi:hypothetical protein